MQPGRWHRTLSVDAIPGTSPRTTPLHTLLPLLPAAHEMLVAVKPQTTLRELISQAPRISKKARGLLRRDDTAISAFRPQPVFAQVGSGPMDSGHFNQLLISGSSQLEATQGARRESNSPSPCGVCTGAYRIPHGSLSRPALLPTAVVPFDIC